MSVIVTHRHWQTWPALVWLAAGLLLLLGATACREGVPVVDVAPKPAVANGTLSGTVTGPAGTSPVDGRVVEAVNIQTGERQRATTNGAGGFTFKLRPGRYRVELALRDGESIVKQPGVIELNRSDVDAHADFVLNAAGAGTRKSPGVSRPRHSYRPDDGLGAPMA